MRRRAGVSVPEAARQLEVSERTIKRWQKRGAPPAACKLFRVLNQCDENGEPAKVVAGEE